MPKKPAIPFATRIYAEVQELFPVKELRVYVASLKKAPTAADSGVRIVHEPTGMEEVCEDSRSQIENFTVAIVRLRVACDRIAALARKKAPAQRRAVKARPATSTKAKPAAPRARLRRKEG